SKRLASTSVRKPLEMLRATLPYALFTGFPPVQAGVQTCRCCNLHGEFVVDRTRRSRDSIDSGRRTQSPGQDISSQLKSLAYSDSDLSTSVASGFSYSWQESSCAAPLRRFRVFVLLRLMKRVVHAPGDPEAVQQHRELACHRCHRTLLPLLATAGADAFSEPAQVTVRTAGTEYVVRACDQ